MKLLNMRRYLALTIAILIANAVSISAQSNDRTAQLTIANSTDATLEIEILGSFRLSDPVFITLPPLTERSVRIPIGVVRFIATAIHSRPIKSYQTEFAMAQDVASTINLTPAMFGTSFLSDTPQERETGITVNISKLTLSGARTCANANLKSGRYWFHSNPAGFGRTDFYEHSSYLCNAKKDGFYYKKGNEVYAFWCSSNWKDCYRQKSYDAKILTPWNKKTGQSRETAKWKWKQGGKEWHLERDL